MQVSREDAEQRQSRVALPTECPVVIWRLCRKCEVLFPRAQPDDFIRSSGRTFFHGRLPLLPVPLLRGTVQVQELVGESFSQGTSVQNKNDGTPRTSMALAFE